MNESRPQQEVRRSLSDKYHLIARRAEKASAACLLKDDYEDLLPNLEDFLRFVLDEGLRVMNEVREPSEEAAIQQAGNCRDE